MTEAAFADQIEWFHQFSMLSPDQLAEQSSEANRVAFSKFAKTSLLNCTPPEDQSPPEFAKTVLALRENERQWNQALCSALIRADDLHKSQALESATSLLESFAKSCPWKLFREVAEKQAREFSARG